MWALAALAATPLTAAAQTEPAASETNRQVAIKLLDQKANQDAAFAFDYGVPTSPALTLTGASPEKLNTSSSLKPFVLSLPDLFSGDGARTVAFDASPAQLMFTPREQRYSEYVNADITYRILFRTRLGLVLDRGEDGGDDPKKGATSKLALGFSTSLFDQSDPLMTADQNGLPIWESCVARNLGELPDKVLQTPAAQRRTQLELAQDLIIATQRAAGPLGTRQSQPPPSIEADIEQIEALLSRLRADAAPTTSSPYDVSLRALETQADQLTGTSKQEVLEAIAVIKRRLGAAAAPATAIDAPAYNTADFDVWLAAAQSQVDAALAALPTEKQAAPTEAYEIRTKALKACAVKASEHAQASRDLDLGGGAVWSGEKGKIGGFEDPSGVIWAAYRLPLRALLPRAGTPLELRDEGLPLQHWVVGGSARMAWKDRLTTGDEDIGEIEADVREAWVGLERLTSSSRLAVQYGWFDGQATEAEHDSFSRSGERWLVSGAYRVSSADAGIWLTFSYGGVESTLDAFDDKVGLVSLTFSPPTLATMFTDP